MLRAECDNMNNHSAVFVIFVLLLTSSVALQPTIGQAKSIDQAPSIEWQQTYDPIGIVQIIQTSDGGFALTGYVGPTPNFVYDGGPCLIKTDSQGNEQWNQTYYVKYPDLNLGSAGPIIQTSDGGFLIGGRYNHGGAFLLKTDSKGNVQWIQKYPSKEYIADLIKTPTGGYVISGPYQNGTECWLALVNSNGIEQWNRDYNGVFIYRIVQANDGGYAMIGEVLASNGSGAALIKTDSEGKIIWNQTYGSSLEYIRFLQSTDAGYILAGNTIRTNTSQGAALLTKTDSLGNILWNQTYSQFGEGTVRDIAKTNDGGYAFGFGDNFIAQFVKVNATGNLQWNISFSFDYTSNVHSVMQLSDGSYVFLAGNALTKTFSDGSLLSVSPTSTVPVFPVWMILSLLTIVLASVGLLVYFKNRHTAQKLVCLKLFIKGKS
jgi:hypothetical protein